MKKLLLAACFTALTMGKGLGAFDVPRLILTPETTMSDINKIYGKLSTDVTLLHAQGMTEVDAARTVSNVLYAKNPILHLQLAQIQHQLAAMSQLCAERSSLVNRFIKKMINVIKSHKIMSTVVLTTLLAATVYGTAYFIITSLSGTVSSECLAYAHQVLDAYSSAFTFTAGKFTTALSWTQQTEAYKWAANTAAPAVKAYATTAYEAAEPYIRTGCSYIAAGLNKIAGYVYREPSAFENMASFAHRTWL